MFHPQENPETVRSHTSQSRQHRRKLQHGTARALTLREAHWLVREAAIRDWPLSLVRASPGEAYEDLYALAAQEEAPEVRQRYRIFNDRARVGGIGR
ncbi:hypothetical protein [Salipiger mangrovisoli]|uniref:Uncharacterized protein n=1 Tax=Salipiger mangrovisoli TaxID=2865933 RepID=A0ABR9X443_9RHOB|nr:hypothetical protein [Salipiger mangrovisoli]MBE9638279.1 hypothetical protein [Salipiger mangrovisoli]